MQGNAEPVGGSGMFLICSGARWKESSICRSWTAVHRTHQSSMRDRQSPLPYLSTRRTLKRTLAATAAAGVEM